MNSLWSTESISEVVWPIRKTGSSSIGGTRSSKQSVTIANWLKMSKNIWEPTRSLNRARQRKSSQVWTQPTQLTAKDMSFTRKYSKSRYPPARRASSTSGWSVPRPNYSIKIQNSSILKNPTLGICWVISWKMVALSRKLGRGSRKSLRRRIT